MVPISSIRCASTSKGTGTLSAVDCCSCVRLCICPAALSALRADSWGLSLLDQIFPSVFLMAAIEPNQTEQLFGSSWEALGFSTKDTAVPRLRSFLCSLIIGMNKWMMNNSLHYVTRFLSFSQSNHGGFTDDRAHGLHLADVSTGHVWFISPDTGRPVPCCSICRSARNQ